MLSACAFNLPRFFDFRIERVPLYEFQRQTSCGLFSANSTNSTSSSSPSVFSILSSSSDPNERLLLNARAHNESLWRQLERPVAIQTPNWRANQFYATVYHTVCMLLFVQFGPLALLLLYNSLLIRRLRQSRVRGKRCSAMSAARLGDRRLVHWATR